MNNSIALLGAGKLGKSFLKGLGKQKSINILASVRSEESRKQLQQNFPHIEVSLDNKTLLQKSKYIFLGVKPQMALAVLRELAQEFTPEHHLISFCARLSLEQMSEVWADTPKSKPILHRLMANTFMEKNTGLFGHTGEAELPNELKKHIESLGLLLNIPESQFDSFTTLSASAPAFVFEFLKGLENFALQQNLDSKIIQQTIPQILRGSASMLSQGESLNERIQQIATEGGMTAEGLSYLRQHKLETLNAQACHETLKKALSFKL